MPPLNDPLPTNCTEAALWWHAFGLTVAPMDPTTKHTRLKWEPWVARLEDEGARAIRAEFRPSDAVCAIVDDTLFILDADTPEAVAALYTIEKACDITPNLIISTQQGEHHYFRKAPGTYAVSRGYAAGPQIDIRTGRSAKEGRSIIVLPPSPGKAISVNEADSAQDLAHAGQDFIDAIYQHNGEAPPRQRAPTAPRAHTGTGEVAEILSHIPPDLGYSDWLTVIMGTHDKYQGDDQGVDALDAWSSTAHNYCGFEEIEYKYHSVKTGGGVTWASVCKMAADNGADLSSIAKGYTPDGEKWRTFDALMAEVATFDQETHPSTIASIVHATGGIDDIERSHLLRAIKRATGTPLGDLRAEIKNSTKKDKEAALDERGLALVVIDKIGSHNLVGTGGRVYGWNERGVWVEISNTIFRQYVQQNLSTMVDSVSSRLVNAVTDITRTEVSVMSHTFNCGDTSSVNCLSGTAVLNGNLWELHPHRREDYYTAQIPVMFDEVMPAPLFEKFLGDIFHGDSDAADKRQALLEMMGYSLMSHAQHEKFILLIGAGGNGKSVLLDVLQQLCGRRNVCAVQPGEFGSSAQRAHLQDKLVNIISEIKQGHIIDDAALKSIVSGEVTTVERKYKDPFEMEPFATCWFGTNHMPHTKDFSPAMFRRAVILRFNNTFSAEKGNADPTLKGRNSRLIPELPGVLRLALEAYARALHLGFTAPASSQLEKAQWRMDSDQVEQFAADRCERVPSARIGITELYREYRQWGEKSGIRHLVTLKSFRQRLTALDFGCKKARSGNVVLGIALVHF